MEDDAAVDARGANAQEIRSLGKISGDDHSLNALALHFVVNNMCLSTYCVCSQGTVVIAQTAQSRFQPIVSIICARNPIRHSNLSTHHLKLPLQHPWLSKAALRSLISNFCVTVLLFSLPTISSSPSMRVRRVAQILLGISKFCATSRGSAFRLLSQRCEPGFECCS